MGATYLNETFSPFILIDTFPNFLFKHVLSTNIVLQVMKVNDESNHSILDMHEWSSCSHNHVLFSSFMITRFLCPRDYWSGGGGGILFYPCPSVRSSHLVCIVCPATSSYSFRATALIFCRMFIHIMEMCMFTGF